MLDFDIFAAADTATALMLALAFLIAYLVERKLAAFRWWAGFYVLIALSVATLAIEPTDQTFWDEAKSWVFLYAAVAIAAFGMYREGERTTRPHGAIIAGAVLLAAVFIALGAVDAPHSAWVFWGAVPTVLFGFWSILHLIGERSHGPNNLTYGLTLFGGTVLIATRSIWLSLGAEDPFAPSFAPPPPLDGLSRSYVPSSPWMPPGALAQELAVEQPLLLSIFTIFAMVSLAVALTLRVALAAVGRMRQRSETDGLSGLLNRTAFDERAAQTLGATGLRPACAVIFDIDHFKRVNDTCGHPAGDRVIAGLGAIIAQACDTRQIAGRIGGEEFAVMLPDCTAASAQLFAEAVRTSFAARDFGADVPFPVTLSAGVAERDNKEPLHALISRADQVLYVAKNLGRNRVIVASDQTEERLSVQLT